MSEPSNHPRIPLSGSDDESMREYGRQMAMDALLQAALNEHEESPVVAVATPPVRRRWRRVVAISTAACLLLVAGGVGLLLRREAGSVAVTETTQRSRPVRLAADWRILPTGNASWHVLDAETVRLDHGEILVESVADGSDTPRSVLTIQTPEGVARASETQFYVGTYQKESGPMKGIAMRQFTRVLVLTGVVTLTNSLGSITGQPDQLLAAEPDKAPVNHAITANSGFAVDLYHQLAKEKPGKNLFFSPYSMSVALAMAAEGARGETAEQMGKVLRFPAVTRQVGDRNDMIPWKIDLIHTGMRDLYERFNPKPVTPEIRSRMEELRKQIAAQIAIRNNPKTDPDDFFKASATIEKLTKEFDTLAAKVDQYELRTANAIWGEQTYPFAKSYIDTVSKFYGTGAANAVDFRGNPEAERLKINHWVEKQTNSRIKDLLPKGSVTGDTSLVLTNAVYFKGEWASPFSPRATKTQEFLAIGSRVKAAMMHQNDLKGAYAAFNADGTLYTTPKEVLFTDRKVYVPANGVQIAELPYKGNALSMVVLVPQNAAGLEVIEEGLTSEKLTNWLAKLASRELDVHMPKFKLETEYNMNDSLRAMGMARAFKNPNAVDGAQFDGMCSSEDSRLKLFIGGVFHKGFVEVTEKGTEAAAATAIGMMGGGIPKLKPYTPVVRADRPFIFLIRDVKTGTILFLGRVTNPGA